MVCKLERPDPQELFDFIKSNFSVNVLFGGDIVPESNEWYVVGNDYMMQEQLYTIVNQQFNARDPRYACCDDLYDMAAQRGFYPRGAGFAQGYIRVTGTPDAAMPSPLEVLIQDQRYQGLGTIPSVMSDEGFVDLRVRAISPGKDGNIAVQGGTGTLTGTTSGIDNEVQVYGSTFCGGTAAEQCEEFRTRYLERLSYKPKATYSWLMEKILEWPCVTRVAHRGGICCLTEGDADPDCACNTCTNKLQFYPLFDNTFDCGIPPQCVIEDMNEWLFGSPQGRGLGQVEIGVCGKLFRPEPAKADVRISGIPCASPEQVRQIKDRVSELFSRAEPSNYLTVRSVEIAIAQVLGRDDHNLAVAFTVHRDDRDLMSLAACGDLDPKCDVMPCLGKIIIVNATVPINVC